MARKLYLHVKVKEVKGATLAADVRLPLPSALWRKDKMLAKAPIAQLMHAFRLRC
ncbi:MAG: hypothetical protein WAL20_03565 [Rhodomicrobium sp.]